MRIFVLLRNRRISKFLIILGMVVCLFSSLEAGTALLCGLAIAVFFGNFYSGETRRYAEKLMLVSISGLGAGMNLIEASKVGLSGLGLTFVSISATLAVCLAIGMLLKADRVTSLLIAVGTAICGGSAIAAVAPVVKAKSESVAVALGTVFILNAVALFLFPYVGHYYYLTQNQFGMWSALAIHDTSSVIGAGMEYGGNALHQGVMIKMVRALWIVPLTLGIAFWQSRKESVDVKSVKKPWFILGFIAMSALVTWVPDLRETGAFIELLAKRGLVMTLFLIGTNLTLSTLKTVGVRPLLQGVASWVLVTIAAFYYVKHYIY